MLEVAGHVGHISLWFSHLVEPGGRVIVFAHTVATTTAVTVPMTTLDAHLGATEVGFIKIDIESAGWDAIQGGKP